MKHSECDEHSVVVAAASQRCSRCSPWNLGIDDAVIVVGHSVGGTSLRSNEEEVDAAKEWFLSVRVAEVMRTSSGPLRSIHPRRTAANRLKANICAKCTILKMNHATKSLWQMRHPSVQHAAHFLLTSFCRLSALMSGMPMLTAAFSLL